MLRADKILSSYHIKSNSVEPFTKKKRKSSHIDANCDIKADIRLEWISVYRQGQKTILCDTINSLNEILDSDD